MGRQHQGGAVVFDEAHHLPANQGRIDGVESAEGFVKDEQFRTVQYSGDELDFLGHALAQVGHFSVPPPFHFEPLEPTLQFPFRIGPGHATQGGEVEHLLRNAHALVEPALLGEVSHAGQQLAVMGLAPHAQLAGIGLGDAGYHAQQRGLARAVGAEQSDNAALLHLDIKRRQGHVVAKRLRDALGVEDGYGHGYENMSRTLSKKPRSSWSESG